jgi:ribonuclease E
LAATRRRRVPRSVRADARKNSRGQARQVYSSCKLSKKNAATRGGAYHLPSLAGRCFDVTARGGGISRKITNAQDRSRLKAIAEELDVPRVAGVILRTAPRAPKRRPTRLRILVADVGTARETLASSAPTLVYEEVRSSSERSAIFTAKRSKRFVAGEAGYREVGNLCAS